MSLATAKHISPAILWQFTEFRHQMVLERSNNQHHYQFRASVCFTASFWTGLLFYEILNEIWAQQLLHLVFFGFWKTQTTGHCAVFTSLRESQDYQRPFPLTLTCQRAPWELHGTQQSPLPGAHTGSRSTGWFCALSFRKIHVSRF